MNAPAIAGVLANLQQLVKQGVLPAEASLLLVPEARLLRLRVSADAQGARLDVSIASSDAELGTAQTLLRGELAQIANDLGTSDIVGRISALVHELMQSAAWTDQVLLPRAHAPAGLPSPAVLAEERTRVDQALRGVVGAPSGWTVVPSVPFPEAWPLVKGAGLVTYVAATRKVAPTLFEHSEVLGCVRHDPLCRMEPKVESWSAAPSSAGVASVVPLDARELERLQSLPSLAECYAKIAAGIPEPALASNLRAHFAFQRRRAAWLFELVRPRHVPLLSWLDTGAT